MPESGATRSAGLTYEDYLQLPDNEGTRYEIVDGDLAVTPSPRIRHQKISSNLFRMLDDHIRSNSLGTLLYAPTDVILDDSSIVVPDLVFVCAERAAIISERAIEGAPDLIIEILSASTAKRDRETKLKLYSRYGVAHYWIVDPESRTIELYERDARSLRSATRGSGSDVIRSALFPGLEIRLGEVWA
jgi:Uma2 family endonuclease